MTEKELNRMCMLEKLCEQLNKENKALLLIKGQNEAYINELEEELKAVTAFRELRNKSLDYIRQIKGMQNTIEKLKKAQI